MKVKHFDWDPAKNARLKRERGISFEEVVFHIGNGDEVDIFDHPNQARYPGQTISVVIVVDYTYLVPFVESETKVILKTIIPSRAATRKYLGDS